MRIIKHSQLFKTPIFMVKPVFPCGKAGILHTKSEKGSNTAYCLFHRPEYRTENGYTTPDRAHLGFIFRMFDTLVLFSSKSIFCLIIEPWALIDFSINLQ